MKRLTIGRAATLVVALFAYAILAEGPGRPMGPGMGRPGRGPGGGPSAAPVPNTPLAKNEAEDKILKVLDDMDKNQRAGMMNVPTDDGRLLRALVETTGAKQVVEIGTSNGYSGLWMALALKATGGKLTTHEIDAKRAALARENFKRAGVDEIVTLVEGDAHKEIANLKGPIDIVFLDADKEGYIDYLNKLLPLVRPGGLIMAHNTTQQAGAMMEYLKAVTTNPDLETVFLNTQATGIGLTLKKR
jgi:predicted O-methyltransferase YrrM